MAIYESQEELQKMMRGGPRDPVEKLATESPDRPPDTTERLERGGDMMKSLREKVARRVLGGGPQKWKGHGDYYFELLGPGALRVTGGDEAKSLTGGKSVVIKDAAKIAEILEIRDAGDLVEEGASYWPSKMLAGKGAAEIEADKALGTAESVTEEAKAGVEDKDFKELYSKEELQEMVEGRSEDKSKIAGLETKDLRGTTGGAPSPVRAALGKAAKAATDAGRAGIAKALAKLMSELED